MRLGLALRAIADLVMPRFCAVCGEKLILKEEHICTFCKADMPLCRFEGMRENPMAQKYNELISKSADYQPYGYAASLFYYIDDYRKIPQAVKYRRNFALGRYYGAMLGEKMAESPLWADVDIVIPVPLHWTRRWRRGYNQAEVIVRGISKNVRTDILRRVRRTKTQVHLHRDDRYANVRTAFSANPQKLKEPLRHILLVDDVFTTGATLCACEHAIRTALVEAVGAEKAAKVRISIATLACVRH